MARNYNHHKYNMLSGEQKSQIFLEDTIKDIMGSAQYLSDEDKFNAINEEINGLNNPLLRYYTSVDNNEEKDTLQPIERKDFDLFAKEYNNVGIANKIKRGAELITAFVIKIAPKVIGMALKEVGNLIDLAGTATKMVGRNLPIGDIGAVANVLVNKAITKTRS